MVAKRRATRRLMAMAAVALGVLGAGPRLAPSAFPEKIENETSAYWMARWARFAEEAVGMDGAQRAMPRVVLLGDSITEGFPADLLPAGAEWVNRGIGGDKIGGWVYLGVRDRLDVSVTALEPDAIVLLIGVNDIVFAGTPAALMREHYGMLLDELVAAAPAARVVVVPVLPVREPFNDHRAQITAFNSEVARLATERAIEVLEVGTALTDAHGALDARFTDDGLHLTRAGYEVWSRMLGAWLSQRWPGEGP